VLGQNSSVYVTWGGEDVADWYLQRNQVEQSEAQFEVHATMVPSTTRSTLPPVHTLTRFIPTQVHVATEWGCIPYTDSDAYAVGLEAGAKVFNKRENYNAQSCERWALS
jgi:hypothetical protein